MKLFMDTFSLLNRVRFKDKLRPVYRFFSDEKSVSTEKTISNSPEKEHIKTPKLYRIDKDEYDSAVENDFLTGITISAYNEYGFRLNQHIQVIGPIILFPRTVFSWHIESVEAITSDSLSIFSIIQPKVDTLIIGTGEFDTTKHIGKNLLDIAHKQKINVEILTTELACTQFNYLNSEGRMVGAALIPPRGTRLGDDDAFQTLSFDSKLFSIESMHTPDVRKLIKKSSPRTNSSEEKS